MFSDLECDMVNPLELCSKLNPVSFFLMYRDANVC